MSENLRLNVALWQKWQNCKHLFILARVYYIAKSFVASIRHGLILASEKDVIGEPYIAA